jgi:hypothetical protein
MKTLAFCFEYVVKIDSLSLLIMKDGRRNWSLQQLFSSYAF